MNKQLVIARETEREKEGKNERDKWRERQKRRDYEKEIERERQGESEKGIIDIKGNHINDRCNLYLKIRYT